jgi:hypothetical protein
MTLSNEAQNLEFAKSVGGAQALIDAAPAEPAGVHGFPLKLAAYLRKTRDSGRKLLESMRTVLDLSDDEQTDEVMYRALAHTSWTIEALHAVLKTGRRLFRKGYLPEKQWPTGLIHDLDSLLEDFEDFQETLALGVSAEFRAALEAAKLASTSTEHRS